MKWWKIYRSEKKYMFLLIIFKNTCACSFMWIGIHWVCCINTYRINKISVHRDAPVTRCTGELLHPYWSAPNHYLDQCWNKVNWTLRNKKLQWNFYQNSNVLIHENTFENAICEMAVILSQPQSDDWTPSSLSRTSREVMTTVQGVICFWTQDAISFNPCSIYPHCGILTYQ